MTSLGVRYYIEESHFILFVVAQRRVPLGCRTEIPTWDLALVGRRVNKLSMSHPTPEKGFERIGLIVSHQAR